MIDDITAFFSYDFVIRAVVCGLLISVAASLLGAGLVLKRLSMIGDGLSHIGFGASAIGLAAGVAPLTVAIPTVIAASFLLIRFNDKGFLKGDSAIAVLSSSALAIGVVAAKLSHGMNVDINNYMFGSIYTISGRDLLVTVILSAVVILLYFLFYNRIFAVTFDESFAEATGVNVSLYTTLISCLTAVTVVIGMRMMGALLISSLLIFPIITAERLFGSYRAVMICSCAVSVLGFIIGILVSFRVNTPPGASVVLVDLSLFILSVIIGSVKNRLLKNSAKN